MKIYRDKQLICLPILIDLLRVENEKQILKWGIQERTAFEWMAYLTEEVGELAKAISEEQYRDGNNVEIIKEAIQVATLALKIAEMFNKEDVEGVKK